MAITGIGSNYNNVYGNTYPSQKNEVTKKAETKDTASVQAGSTKSTAADKVADYYSYLQKNFDCVKNGSVAISGSYLKECANNPEKAKELEEEREEKLKEKKEQERIEEKKREQKEQEEVRLEKIQVSAESTTVISDAYHKPVDIKA